MRKESILNVERIELQQIQGNSKTKNRLEKVAKTVFQNPSILEMVVDDIVCYLDDEVIVPNPAQWDIFFDELVYSDLRYFFHDNAVQMSGLSMASMGTASFAITPEAFITVERAVMQDEREMDI